MLSVRSGTRPPRWGAKAPSSLVQFSGSRPAAHCGVPCVALPTSLGPTAEGRVSVQMQSNGTLVNDEWIEVLKRHNLRVGVSLDGPPEIHDIVRVDHAGRGSYSETVQGLRKLQENRVFSCVLTVINPGQSGLEIYRHIRSLGVKNMNFLLPDVTHDSRRIFYPDSGATPISDYLIPIFDDWFDEDDPTW